MKIIIDARSMTSQLSGIGRYSLEMIKAYVRQYGEDSIEILVNQPITYLPYKYTVVPYERHAMKGVIGFSKYLYGREYDLYHATDLIGPLSHKKGRKHIVTCHDLMHFMVPNFFRLSPLKTFLRKANLRVLFGGIVRDADEIISVSATTARDLKKMFHVESIVLREGINKIETDVEPEQYAGLTKNSFFLYVGLGMRHKNIDFLVRSFLQSKSDKKLVIAGKGHTLVDSDRIIYTGYIEDKHLDFLYRNCAAFIFPSLYEGFGLPILEALSYHCRVFSSNAGSLGEFSDEVIHFFAPTCEHQLIDLIHRCDCIMVDTDKIDTYLKKFNWGEIWEEYFNNAEINACALSSFN